MNRKRVPDLKKAQSLLGAAVMDIEFVETIQVTDKTSRNIVSGIYESFRMLGEALLTAQGKEFYGADHHIQMIDAIIKLNIKTVRPLLLLHELRKLRHKINYEGYVPDAEEVKSALDIKEALWKPVVSEVRKIIE